MDNYGFSPTPMFPNVTVGGCIEIFENTVESCDTIINNVENECADVNSGVNWSRATTINQSINQTARTNFDLGITYYVNSIGNQVLRNIHNGMNDLIHSAAASYCQRQGINEQFFFEGYNMLKYQTGAEYKAHYDGSTGIGRHISCILYLNDAYDGGEIEFPNFNLKIKPEKAMLILFPSNFAYRHIAHPVISGTKYAIVTWLHDRPV